MGKEQILDLLDHIHQREAQYGVTDAFRFKRYYNGKALVLAEYAGDDSAESQATAREPGTQPHGTRPNSPLQSVSDTARQPHSMPQVSNTEQATRPNTPPRDSSQPHINMHNGDDAAQPQDDTGGLNTPPRDDTGVQHSPPRDDTRSQHSPPRDDTGGQNSPPPRDNEDSMRPPSPPSPVQTKRKRAVRADAAARKEPRRSKRFTKGRRR
jgi:hypothetical protein